MALIGDIVYDGNNLKLLLTVSVYVSVYFQLQPKEMASTNQMDISNYTIVILWLFKLFEAIQKYVTCKILPF